MSPSFPRMHCKAIRHPPAWVLIERLGGPCVCVWLPSWLFPTEVGWSGCLPQGAQVQGGGALCTNLRRYLAACGVCAGAVLAGAWLRQRIARRGWWYEKGACRNVILDWLPTVAPTLLDYSQGPMLQATTVAGSDCWVPAVKGPGCTSLWL